MSDTLSVRPGVLTADDSPAVYHRGLRLPLAPMAARLLGVLVRQSSATYADLQAVLKPTTGCDAIAVHMTAIRKALPENVAVVAVRRFGYRLDFLAPAETDRASA